ncbi:hypothetical protein OPQ81_000708 [Rhizoctonia solani]|nr:hypothetical protein OPQ81_000708 [Rhizoctonia solani]
MDTKDKASFETPEHIDHAASSQHSGDNDAINHWTPDERARAEKKLVRKLDCRLMPSMIVIFIMNYIDRTAVTAARLRGLEADLGLSDVQYQTVLAILYVSYCTLQVPSNMILNKVSRPSWYIGGCVIAWGLVSALTGVTHNFAGIVACRVFIGVPEAAFYPGATYILSRWYTRKELAFRAALLYFGLLVSNAFGSLMAAGILSGMQGKRGDCCLEMAVLYRAITIVIGMLAIWLLPDYPHNTHWIKGTERRLAQARLAEDAAEADEDGENDSAYSGLIMALKDPKVPILAIMNCSQLLGLSFVNFFPTLTATLGYNTTISLLLAAPPWILASIICLLNAWHADKTGERFFHIAGWWWVVIVAYIIALSTMETAGRYVSMFLMASGYAGFALTLVWVSNAVPRPPAKRAAAIGIINGFGNVGNLIGSFTWKAQWSPKYHQSMIIGIATLALSTVLAFIVRTMLVRANRKMDQQDMNMLENEGDAERVREAARLEGITVEEAMRRRRGFRRLGLVPPSKVGISGLNLVIIDLVFCSGQPSVLAKLHPVYGTIVWWHVIAPEHSRCYIIISTQVPTQIHLTTHPTVLENNKVVVTPLVPTVHSKAVYELISEYPCTKDKILGIISFCHASPALSTIEIGSVIVFPPYQGTHVSTHAIGLMMHYALEIPSRGGLGVRRLQWQAYTINVPSIKVAERMGFKQEAIVRWQRPQAVEIKVCAPLSTEDDLFVPGRHSAHLSVCWDDWEGGRQRKGFQIDDKARIR